MLNQTEDWDAIIDIIDPIDVDKSYDLFNTNISELIYLSNNSFEIKNKNNKISVIMIMIIIITRVIIISIQQ